MLAALGRAFQVTALIGLPIALLYWNATPVKLFASLGFFASLFLIGRIIEGHAKS
jgi:hypothetical protein